MPDPSRKSINFARRSRCSRCKTKNIEETKGNIKIGEAAADASKGFFSADYL